MKNSFDILIIDDEQVVIDAIKKVSKLYNLTADSVLDASLAIYNLLNTDYKLIICDIMMPVLDGFKFLDQLKEKDIKTPVIMTTGFSTVENAVKSLSKGAIAFIPKPFTFDEIASIIHRGLDYSKLTNNKGKADDSTVLYVPCPSQYYKLSYSYWMAKESNGSVLIGVTDLFMKTINTLKSIELLETETLLIQGNPAARFYTEDDLMHTPLASISGKIIETNQTLLQNPLLLEKDPYFEGWLYRLIPTDFDFDIANLTQCRMDIN